MKMLLLTWPRLHEDAPLVMITTFIQSLVFLFFWTVSSLLLGTWFFFFFLTLSALGRLDHWLSHSLSHLALDTWPRHCPLDTST